MFDESDESDELDLLVRKTVGTPIPVVSSATFSQFDLDRVTESPLFPVKPKEFLNILKILLKSGIPTSLTYISGFLKGLISLAFVGKYGSHTELAGASLATGLGSVVLMAVMYSINQGFGIITCHLYGAEKYKEIGTLLQRNLCVITALSIPIFLLLSFSDYILIAIGTEPDVSYNTATYFRYSIPSFVGLYVSDCVKSFLIAQNNFFFAGAMQVIMLAFHVICCYLLVVVFNMPFIGAALAKSITDALCAVMLLIYIKSNSEFKDSLVQWSKDCLKNWWPHLKDTMTIGFSVYVGQILFEFSVLVVIMLNDAYVMGAHSTAILLSTSFFMITSGNSLAMQAYVGNAMGEGLKYKAQKFMVGGLFLNVIGTVLFMAVMFFCNDLIISQFTDVPETRDILRNFMYINCIMYPADTFKDHFEGILRTTGREKEVFHILVVCYFVFGINAQWILSLILGFGYSGVWISIAGTLYMTLIVLFFKLIWTDWDVELNKIKHRMIEYKDLPFQKQTSG